MVIFCFDMPDGQWHVAMEGKIAPSSIFPSMATCHCSSGMSREKIAPSDGIPDASLILGEGQVEFKSVHQSGARTCKSAADGRATTAMSAGGAALSVTSNSGGAFLSVTSSGGAALLTNIQQRWSCLCE